MNKNQEATSMVVAKINGVSIVVVDNGEKRVPVRPICEALGISYQPQIERLREDPILSSTVTLSVTVGADGKDREMVTIPFMYVFGWLFRIDSRNVKEEARDAVLKYQVECYKALYDHFTRQTEFLKARQAATDSYIEAYDEARRNFKDAEKIMRETKNELDRVRSITFSEWLIDQSQLTLFSPNEMGG